jgi:hypothetical protein
MSIQRYNLCVGIVACVTLGFVVLECWLFPPFGLLGAESSKAHRLVAIGLILATWVGPLALFRSLVRAKCPQCGRSRCRLTSKGVVHQRFSPVAGFGPRPKPGERTREYLKCEFCGWEEPKP